MTTTEADLTASAWHEAGHVTGYLAHGLSVRYATLRPRTKGVVARTAVRRMVADVKIRAVIAHAGPLAQGMHAWQTRGSTEGFPERDYIAHAYVTGANEDLIMARDAPRSSAPDGTVRWEWFARNLLVEHWLVVTVIAETLLARMTVNGAEMRALAVGAGMTGLRDDGF